MTLIRVVLARFSLGLMCLVSFCVAAAAAVDGLSQATAFSAFGHAHHVTSDGLYHFNVDGQAFSSFVTTDGFISVYGDVVANNAGQTPRTTSLAFGDKGYLSEAIMAAMSGAKDLRIVSYPIVSGASAATRLDAITQNTTLIGRVVGNTMLGRGVGDNTLNASWAGIGTNYLRNATCHSPSRNGSLQDNVFHACGNPNALHWQPFSKGGFAIDFNGENNKSNDNPFGFGDERLDAGSVLLLMLRFEEVALPSVEVMKSSNVPSGTPVELGQEIIYTYTVTNTGGVVLGDVIIDDDHLATEELVDFDIEAAVLTDNAPFGDSVNTDVSNDAYDAFGPGDVLRVTSKYYVTADDIARFGQ